MNRRGNDSNNRLLYDPNQREQRRLGAFSMLENEEITEEEPTDIEQENSNPENNLMDENTSENENVSQGSAAGTGARKVTSQAGAAAANVVKKAASKVAMFIMANPWILAVIAFLIIFVIILFAAAGGDAGNIGYYDKQCNFNDTMVDFSTCDGEFYTSMSLEEYVLRYTLSITDKKDFNNEAIKAIMIIAKTNALSNGNYNSSYKRIGLNDCSRSMGLYSSIETDAYKNLEKIYDTIENEIFVSSSYRESIKYLNSQNALEFTDSTIDEIKEIADFGNSYEQILNGIYNSASSETDDTDEYRSNLYIGDSRMQGMQIAGVVSTSNSIYGVGYGYDWFVGSGNFDKSNTNATSGGINGINAMMTSGKKYNIIIWLGINDYQNNTAADYFEKYYELATNEWSAQNIYVVSVGPVDDSLAENVNNAGINNFNSEMAKLINDSGLENLVFLDLNYAITSYDYMGVHYSSSDYKNIFNMIQEKIDVNLNSKYVLYNLSNYCTFYQVTENELYWWPIGSKDATNGNIYGGTPTTTTITSPFGMRSGVYETARQHNGIDIAGGTSCYENVIIASKGGTVIEVNDSCPTDGYVGSDCGSGLGNYVVIEHDDGIRTLYAHMSLDSIVVSENDKVVQGQKLGLMGSSGSSTGCHLHFGVKVNGSYVNPTDYVSKDNPRPITVHSYIGAGAASENKEYVCKSLLLSGYSEESVAGMMVNIQHEGGFRTDNLENCYEEDQCCKINGKNYGFCNYKNYLQGFATDEKYTLGIDNGTYSRDSFINDHAGYGLIQWTSSGRKANLYDFAKSKGKSISDIDVQLEYLLNEIQNYPVTYKYITGNYKAFDIASAFCKDFESPSGSVHDLTVSDSCTTRASSVDLMLEYVKNGCK